MKPVSICTLILLAALPALAQNDMSWVSHSGSDSNTCTLALPCRTFQVALNNTNNNGIVKALDAGEYGTMFISKPITIDGNGVGASIQVTGTGVNGMNLSASPVQIRNLAIHMSCTSCEGIFSSNNNVTIDNVTIDGTPAIGLKLDGGSATIQNVTVTGATTTGIDLYLLTGSITDSVVRSSNNGITVSTVFTSSAVASVLIERSKIISNTTGLAVQNFGGASDTVWISDCVITGNGTGTTAFGGGQLITLRNNTWADNTTDGSTPFSVSLK
jgi:hypothetical protein